MEFVSSISSQVPNVSSTTDYGDVLDKDDFLRLLIAQISHQDPMDPLSNDDFINQMTQFSSLEQLQSINEGVETSLFLSQSLNNAYSAALIGREAVVKSDAIVVESGVPQNTGFYAPSSGYASVSVVDSGGNTVQTFGIDVSESGFVDIDWDGIAKDGNAVDDGLYTFEIEFTDDDGAEQVISPFVQGKVTSVKFSGGNAYLEIEGKDYNLSKVIEIREWTDDG